MAWIELHQGLVEHPKTGRLARELGLARYAAVGLLAATWTWAISYAQDGDLTGLVEDLADHLRWGGGADRLLEALVVAGWVDEAHGRVTLHDWAQYGGRTLARRHEAVARTQRAREAKSPRIVHEPSAPVARNERETSAHVERLHDSTGHDKIPPSQGAHAHEELGVEAGGEAGGTEPTPQAQHSASRAALRRLQGASAPVGLSDELADALDQAGALFQVPSLGRGGFLGAIRARLAGKDGEAFERLTAHPDSHQAAQVLGACLRAQADGKRSASYVVGILASALREGRDLSPDGDGDGPARASAPRPQRAARPSQKMTSHEAFAALAALQTGVTA